MSQETARGSAIAHGGRLVEARRLFPGAPEPFVDLSTGINPVAYPLPVLPPDVWTRLPEPEAQAALERIAATAYGVADPAMVVAAPGTQALISLLPRLLFGAARPPAAVLSPTYAEHAAAWHAAGHEVTEVADPEGLRGTAIAVLCNPNNPDGRRIPAATLRGFAGHGLLVVDEAFADLEPAGLSLAPLLPLPGVVVLRSFGKAYGLAGLRLGFALAEPRIAAALRAALGPWAVSGPAIAVGEAALADRAWAEKAAARLAADAARLDALLTVAGLRVLGGTRLFRLAERVEAPALFRLLGRAGILARRFPGHPSWLRFGMPGNPAAWARLAAALTNP